MSSFQGIFFSHFFLPPPIHSPFKSFAVHVWDASDSDGLSCSLMIWLLGVYFVLARKAEGCLFSSQCSTVRSVGSSYTKVPPPRVRWDGMDQSLRGLKFIGEILEKRVTRGQYVRAMTMGTQTFCRANNLVFSLFGRSRKSSQHNLSLRNLPEGAMGIN